MRFFDYPAMVLAFVLPLASRSASQSSFRSSLTATLMIPPGDSRGKSVQYDSGRSGGNPALRCKAVTLQWSALPGATRFVVHVSGRSTGPWTVLPETNVCGRVRWNAPTTVMDIEPTTGAPAVSHHLYYKVVALGPAPASRVIDVTEPVDVEFP